VKTQFSELIENTPAGSLLVGALTTTDRLGRENTAPLDVYELGSYFRQFPDSLNFASLNSPTKRLYVNPIDMLR
jgi:hypothetical protein